MQVTVGPDGFLATSVALDHAPQVLITEYLRQCQSVGNKALEEALPRLRKTLRKPELVGLIRAAHARIAWIVEHDRELSEPGRWQDFLVQLVRNLYLPSLPFEEADLIALLKGHREHRALWSFGPEELLVAFVESHDLSPELADELRRFQAGLKGGPGKMKYQNQSGYQVAVAQIHMLLWHDEHDPLDPSDCWSDIVRRDLRAMTGARRAHWKALFRHIKGNAPAKPAKGWITEAETRLARVGRQDFLDRLQAWLAPLRSGEPQPLGVAGSHLLRGLLWYAALTRDPGLGPIVLTLLDAKWKAKRNLDKVMVALVGLLEALPPTEAWPLLLRLQQEWPTSSVQVERLLKQTAEKFGITEEELKARAAQAEARNRRTGRADHGAAERGRRDGPRRWSIEAGGLPLTDPVFAARFAVKIGPATQTSQRDRCQPARSASSSTARPAASATPSISGRCWRSVARAGCRSRMAAG